MLEPAPVTPADLPLLTALRERVDLAWFGRAETLPEDVARAVAGAAASVVLRHAGVVVGLGLVAGPGTAHGEASLLVDPVAGPQVRLEVARALLGWVAGAGGRRVVVPAREEALTATLQEAEWRRGHASYEMVRRLDDVPPAEVGWPCGVHLDDFGPGDVERVHRLVVGTSGELPDVDELDLPRWRALFVDPPGCADGLHALVVDEAGRCVGAAVNRAFPPDLLWISQLAVRPDARGHGVGRGLVEESAGRAAQLGLPVVGLQVRADNAAALRLYRQAGFCVRDTVVSWRAP